MHLLLRAPRDFGRLAPKGAVVIRRGHTSRDGPLTAAAAIAPSDPGASQLGLPFAVGNTWVANGPHNFNGCDYTDRHGHYHSCKSDHPWGSLDFGQLGPGYTGDGIVRAARAGVWSHPCANEVRVDHGDGWSTTYYHLVEPVPVPPNGTVVRGQSLGRIAAPPPHNCGGYGTGAHTHFTQYFNGVEQPFNGRAIGGWLVREGANQYEGSFTHLIDGRTVSVFAALRNDGTVGTGTTGASDYTITAVIAVRAGPGNQLPCYRD
jgi:LasA protease